ncbi:hypothetical protein [Pseudomonas sp. NPDC089547]|uniref:hypothetical protein n=1 Tax=Pseudomonas sp. NPDC089547 TaxID=3390652 RepID=UPI003CFCDC48
MWYEHCFNGICNLVVGAQIVFTGVFVALSCQPLAGQSLVIGLCWFALGLASLAVLIAGFRRPVRLVDFSEADQGW